MAQKKVTENYIRQIIKQKINEMYTEGGALADASGMGMMEAGQGGADVFAQIEEEVRTKSVDIENQIETLQNNLAQFRQVIPVLKQIDAAIKEQCPEIQGPTYDRDDVTYTLPQPIQFDNEADSYGSKFADDIEYIVEDEIPDDFKDYLNVWPLETYDRAKQTSILSGVRITIEWDDMKGWY